MLQKTRLTQRMFFPPDLARFKEAKLATLDCSKCSVISGRFRHLVEFASQTLEATANEPQMYLTDTFGFFFIFETRRDDTRDETGRETSLTCCYVELIVR